MGTPLRVLFIEDNPDDVLLVKLELTRCGYDIDERTSLRVETAKAFVAAVDRPWDIMISDFHMPTFSAPEALAVCRERGVTTPFIIVSGTVDEEQAVTALRSGASDFISKHKLTRLGPAVAREIRDFAEREAGRKAKDQLLQAQKMDAIGHLAGGVAHDLNNILSVILGHSQIAMRHLEGDSPVVRRVSSIADAAQRGAALVRQLLAVGSRQVLQPKVISLNEVVRDTVSMLERIIGEHVVVSTELEENLWPVRADISQTEQLIMNLVINARDAMPEGGEVHLSTRNTVLAARLGELSGDCAVLEVRDTGHGMDEATQARIFEPFFTTKGPGRGTGLGLATVYGIVKQSGGYIEVESQIGRGATFRVYLPRSHKSTKMSAPGRSAASTKKAEPGHEVILLVEDDVAMRGITSELLTQGGYRLLVAESAEAAIGISSSYAGPIDLLLTDVVMPKIGGFELAERLVSKRPDLKVVFMSGYSDPTQRRQAVPGLYIAKPFTVDVLLTTVREALDKPAPPLE